MQYTLGLNINFVQTKSRTYFIYICIYEIYIRLSLKPSIGVWCGQTQQNMRRISYKLILYATTAEWKKLPPHRTHKTNNNPNWRKNKEQALVHITYINKISSSHLYVGQKQIYET